jgi:hypothetical protein
MPEADPSDPIERERAHAREHSEGVQQEAVAGTGTGAVPSAVEVSIEETRPVPRAGGAVSLGAPPEEHRRPATRSDQLDGLEEENHEREAQSR